jgi:hypothetical protein
VDNRGAVLLHDPELVSLAGQLLETIAEFSADIAGQIQARVDFYAGTSDVSTEDLRRSCRANAEFVLRSMRDDDLQADVSAAQETGRRRAEQGVPLPYVMAAFRVGFSRIWKRLVEQARAAGQVSSDVLVDAASDIWAVDEIKAHVQQHQDQPEP